MIALFHTLMTLHSILFDILKPGLSAKIGGGTGGWVGEGKGGDAVFSL